MTEKAIPRYRHIHYKPWLVQFNGTYVCCLMCSWVHHPRTRNGLAKALREHRRCGFCSE